MCSILNLNFLVLFHRVHAVTVDCFLHPGECFCCKQIEKCVDSLGSTAVLGEGEILPQCVIMHPRFSAVCLNRWSLILASVKYKMFDGTKYCQIGTEEK